jgi:hypothetical protein
MYKGAMHVEYLRQLNEELKEGIIAEATIDQCASISPTFLVPKKGGEWRKILDCRRLNVFIMKEGFQMEDNRTVAMLLERDHWTVSIDIHSAYHHVSVSPDMQRFLSFQYGTRFFQYTAMPFGVRSAPRIFTRIMKQAITAIREIWKITTV